MFFGLDVDLYLLFFKKKNSSMSRNWENLNKNNKTKMEKIVSRTGGISPHPPRWRRPCAYVNMFAASFEFDGTDLTALTDHIVSDDSQF